MAKEHGIEPDAVSDEEFAEIQKREQAFVDEHELSRLTERYCQDAGKILETKEEWLIFSTLDEDLRDEMPEIIYWYQFFIAAKIQRGLSSLLDYDGKYDEAELNDPQSDANGSVKIALIAVERSLMVWTSLLSPENAAQISGLISLLKTIRRKTEKKSRTR